MSTSYFKTSDPKQRVYLSRLGKWAPWQYVDVDVGVLMTNNTSAIEDLRALQKQGVGSVTEIKESVYSELLSKKKDPKALPKKWREEFSMGQAQPTIQAAKPESPPVAKPADKVDSPVTNLNRATLPKPLRPKASKSSKTK